MSSREGFELGKAGSAVPSRVNEPQAPGSPGKRKSTGSSSAVQGVPVPRKKKRSSVEDVEGNEDGEPPMSPKSEDGVDLPQIPILGPLFNWVKTAFQRQKDGEPVVSPVDGERVFRSLVADLKKEVKNKEVADFARCNLQNDGARRIGEAVEGNTVTRTLILSKNRIGPQGAKWLGRGLVKSGVECLSLDCNDIRDVGLHGFVNAMSEGWKLRFLDLGMNQIGPDGIRDIARVLTADGVGLETLSLSANHIFDNGAKELGKALLLNQSVTTLLLGGCNIGCPGATGLASVLKTSNTITKLDISENKIRADGATAIAEALANNQGVTLLYFYHNMIGDEGVTALSQKLSSNTTLKGISLGSNQCSDKAGVELANLLKLPTCALNTVYMDRNNLADGSATALGQALRTNQHLVKLCIHSNLIKGPGAQALIDGLQGNTQILTLRTVDNLFGPKKLGEISDLEDRNRGGERARSAEQQDPAARMTQQAL